MVELVVVATRTMLVLVVFHVSMVTPRLKNRESLIHRLEDHVRFNDLDLLFMAATVAILEGAHFMGIFTLA